MNFCGFKQCFPLSILRKKDNASICNCVRKAIETMIFHVYVHQIGANISGVLINPLGIQTFHNLTNNSLFCIAEDD